MKQRKSILMFYIRLMKKMLKSIKQKEMNLRK
nr:MAG TPA: hypothetical protein [Caudoviricetes sp.]